MNLPVLQLLVIATARLLTNQSNRVQREKTSKNDAYSGILNAVFLEVF